MGLSEEGAGHDSSIKTARTKGEFGFRLLSFLRSPELLGVMVARPGAEWYDLQHTYSSRYAMHKAMHCSEANLSLHNALLTESIRQAMHYSITGIQNTQFRVITHFHHSINMITQFITQIYQCCSVMAAIITQIYRASITQSTLCSVMDSDP